MRDVVDWVCARVLRWASNLAAELVPYTLLGMLLLALVLLVMASLEGAVARRRTPPTTVPAVKGWVEPARWLDRG